MNSIDNPIIFYPILIHVGFIAGFFGSMLGLGGGWLTVPALQLFGVEPMTAVGTSLTAMIFNAATGTYKYYRKKILQLSLGLVLAGPALIGVYVGKNTLAMLAAAGQSEVVLQYAFIVLMVTLGIVMTISSRKKESKSLHKLPGKWAVLGPAVQINEQLRIGVLNTCVVGLTAGFLSGLLGIGGGIIMTPALVFFFGISIVQAASASLVSVLISSLLGSSLYWYEGKAIFIYAIILAASTAAGSYLGSSLAPRMHEGVLKKIFACLAFLTATALILKGTEHSILSVIILLVGASILFLFALKAKKKESLS